MSESTVANSHLSVDDHPLLREGLAAIINSQNDMTLVAEAASARKASSSFARICRMSL